MFHFFNSNKILPGSNAQLLMPDLATDVHAAVSLKFQCLTNKVMFIGYSKQKYQLKKTITEIYLNIQNKLS